MIFLPSVSIDFALPLFSETLQNQLNMGHPLDKLTLRGFRSIQNLESFELRPLNVLIGANGAGKSNFVEFFRLMSAMMKKDGLREYVAGNADSYLYGGVKQTKQIEVSMVFGENGYEFRLQPTEDGFFVINEEQCFNNAELHKGNTYTARLGSGNFDSKLLEMKGRYGEVAKKTQERRSWEREYDKKFQAILEESYDALCSWRIYHFHDTSVQAGMRRYQDANHYKDGSGRPVLSMDADNIAPYLLWLRGEDIKVYQRIIEVVQLAIPFFDDFILDARSDDRVRLEWRQKGLKDYPMRPTQLSDGSIRFICLATALLQPELPSTVIIDEPELGLHPFAISLLAELIQSAACRTQVIVATQSQALVDQFAVEDVVVVSRKKGASEFRRLKEEDYKQWLEDYSLGELWSKNVITGGPVYE